MNVKQTVSYFLNVLFKQPEKLTDVCSDNITLHWRGQPLIQSLDELTAFAKAQMQCFPTLAFDVQDIIVEDNRAAVRLVQTGRLEAEWEGIQANGASYTIVEMMFFRLENNVITEVWPLPDMEGKKQQILDLDKY